MQFIRNIMNDIKKCIRIAAKMRNWWRRSSKAARITSSVLLASLLIAWLCFIIFETVNMVSYSSRYSAKLQNSVLIQREKMLIVTILVIKTMRLLIISRLKNISINIANKS